MVSGEDFDDGDAVGIVASDIDDDVAAAREKVTTRCGDDVAGANAIVIIGTARRIRRNDHVVNSFSCSDPTSFPDSSLSREKK
jgi:hypothetical protein